MKNLGSVHLSKEKNSVARKDDKPPIDQTSGATYLCLPSL